MLRSPRLALWCWSLSVGLTGSEVQSSSAGTTASFQPPPLLCTGVRPSVVLNFLQLSHIHDSVLLVLPLQGRFRCAINLCLHKTLVLRFLRAASPSDCEDLELRSIFEDAQRSVLERRSVWGLQTASEYFWESFIIHCGSL